MRRLAAVVLATGAFLVVGGLMRATGPGSAGAQRGTAPPTERATDPPAVPGGVRGATQPGASRPAAAVAANALLDWRGLEASLRGSGIDGEVRLGAGGEVLVDAGLRRLFDHVLSLVGERSPARIRELLAAHLQQVHGPAVAQQVLDVFDRYVALQAAIARADLAAIADPAERLRRLASLRRAYFDAADAEAMFGEDERYAAYAVQRIALATDRTRDPVARAADVAALEAALPEPARAAIAEAGTPALLLEQQRQFDQLGIDAGARHAERAALWGPEAADRLAALDAERAAWDARVQDYVRAREAILHDASLPAQERESRIAALRAARFDAAGQRRVAALEAIGRLGAF
jgi:lipase chaperone LimK